MTRFTLQITDQLNTWLTEQAALNHRSKNKQIEHLLELARRIPILSKAQDKPRYQLGTPRLCANGTHLFASPDPATNDFCNCRVFVFGEVMGRD